MLNEKDVDDAAHQKNKNMSEKIITRFPPSPTGNLHIGSARTALFNYLFAVHEGGEVLLRFEDTDRERSKKEFEENILEGLHWLGLPFANENTPRQSERTAVYEAQLQKLIAGGNAYEAEGSESNPDKKVVRFKNPNTRITFTDLIRGDVSFDTTELGDFVIAKSVTEPLYHLAVVVDDADMGVTHIVRGEDHISNTPRQILILEALGFARPQYAHIPLILAPDKTKLSKRHGAVSITEYRNQGFIPEAIINYLALLGWNPGGEEEVFTLQELSKQFTLERVHKGGAVFDVEKLKWFNHEHLKRLSAEEFTERLTEFLKHAGHEAPAYLAKGAHVLRERCRTLQEAADALAQGELGFLEERVSATKELLLNNGKLDAARTSEHLHALLERIEALPEVFTADDIKNALFNYATEQGRGDVLWPLRTALSGRTKSPDPFTIAALIGKTHTRARIEEARKIL